MVSESSDEAGDFFAVLVQEHAGMEARLRALDRAADSLSRTESDPAALGVIAETLEFFATEGARHEAHEELTLFPRLRPLPEFKQILVAMDFQHRMNGAAGVELAACVERFAPGSGRELRRLATRFVEMHRGHVVAEERAVFPTAAAALSAEALAEMGREMRDRRKAGELRIPIPPRTM